VESPASTEAYLDQSDYPAWWNFDEDGDVADGTFIRFTRGSSEFGEKTICVLSIDGEERSVWLHEAVLYDEFRRELLRRPTRELDPNEHVVIKRLDKRKTADGKRSYRAFRVVFPDRPERTTNDLFKLDEETPTVDKPAEDDDSVPF
jgi:hypothetical protein